MYGVAGTATILATCACANTGTTTRAAQGISVYQQSHHCESKFLCRLVINPKFDSRNRSFPVELLALPMLACLLLACSYFSIQSFTFTGALVLLLASYTLLHRVWRHCPPAQLSQDSTYCAVLEVLCLTTPHQAFLVRVSGRVECKRGLLCRGLGLEWASFMWRPELVLESIFSHADLSTTYLQPYICTCSFDLNWLDLPQQISSSSFANCHSYNSFLVASWQLPTSFVLL